MEFLVRCDATPRGKDSEGGLGPSEDRQRRRSAPASHPSRRTDQGRQNAPAQPGWRWWSGRRVQEQRSHQEGTTMTGVLYSARSQPLSLSALTWSGFRLVWFSFGLVFVWSGLFGLVLFGLVSIGLVFVWSGFVWSGFRLIWFLFGLGLFGLVSFGLVFVWSGFI